MKINDQGISLVEVVLVCAAVIFLGLLIVGLASPIASINKSRHTSLAKEIASSQIENLRKQTYEVLKGMESEEMVFSDSRLSALPSSAASYKVEDCPLEICPSEEKIKKVMVKVSWSESGETKKVELTTLVGEGGIGQ